MMEFLHFLENCEWDVPESIQKGDTATCNVYCSEYDIQFSESQYLSSPPFANSLIFNFNEGNNNSLWFGVETDVETGDSSLSSKDSFATDFNSGNLTTSYEANEQGIHNVNMVVYVSYDFITANGSESMDSDDIIDLFENEGFTTVEPQTQYDWVIVILQTKNILVRDTIATATSTVVDGESHTNTLNYRANHSYSDFIPGNIYTIYGEYLQNNQYQPSQDIGTLEILKIPTTTTLSTNNVTSMEIESNATLTVTVTDNINNTTLNNGNVKLYDNNTLIQTVPIPNGATNIVYTPSTAGVHTLRAVYESSSTQYNTSQSSTSNITVTKKPTSISLTNNSISMYFGENEAISGILSSRTTNLSGKSISLVDFNNSTTLDTTTTGPSGSFSFTYSPANWNIDGNNLYVKFIGDDTYDGYTKSVPVTLNKHTANVTIFSTSTVTKGNNAELIATVEDESYGNVTTGSLTWTLTAKQSTSIDVVVDTGDTNYNNKITVSDLPNDATGTCSVTIPNVLYDSFNVGNTREYVFVNLHAGDYTLTVTYNGDYNYISSTVITDITILQGDCYFEMTPVILSSQYLKWYVSSDDLTVQEMYDLFSTYRQDITDQEGNDTFVRNVVIDSDEESNHYGEVYLGAYNSQPHTVSNDQEWSFVADGTTYTLYYEAYGN